jgi:deoxycytidine triphosphate deaminase/predicted NUDIX family phosphoesterase
MDERQGLDHCLADFELREWAEQGKLVMSGTPEEIRRKIQPCSTDPVIGDEAFLITSVFMPDKNKSIYRTLLEMPSNQRLRIDLDRDPLLPGHAYLVRLEEKLWLQGREMGKCSPKSSGGRTFMNARQCADFNDGWDYIRSHGRDIMRDLWLLLQPEIFVSKLCPGISLNQLRIFTGPDAALTIPEILEEHRKHPLMYLLDRDMKKTPAELVMSDTGIEINLDLQGLGTSGICALKAREVPKAVDFSQKGAAEWKTFFQALKAEENRLTAHERACYLLASQQLLDMPPHLSGELEEFSVRGIEGSLHRAGFIDPGFEGDLVFEVTIKGRRECVLVHGMPMGHVRIYRNGTPERCYGKEIGSHYYKQVGPKVAKYFTGVDWADAAKTYPKMNREVLCIDAKVLPKFRDSEQGFELLTPEKTEALLEEISNGLFRWRDDCESDELLVQPIPYLVVIGHDMKIFEYVRPKDKKKYAEPRLAGDHSVGIGGHIMPGDAPDYVGSCLAREEDEEVTIDGKLSKPRLIGTIMCYDKEVDKYHLALVHVAYLDGTIQPKDTSIEQNRMVNLHDLWQPFKSYRKYETWSKEIIKNHAIISIEAVHAAEESGIEVKIKES